MNPTDVRDALRAELRSRRAAFPAALRKGASAWVVDHLLAWDRVAAVRVLAVYRATAVEVNVEEVARRALVAGRAVAVPAYDAALRGYRFVPQRSDTVWVRGPFEITQPADCSGCQEMEIGMVLVPGLAFDREGNRLGHGAGHYDRMLAGGSALRVGVAFDLQMVERIPARDGDVAMDWIVTEKGLFPCERSARRSTERGV
jgi:5-formyltetrahydrofolate cyclo-ligase